VSVGFGRTIVTVSRNELLVEQRDVWRTKHRAVIPAADIVDIDFSTRESVVESARLAAARKLQESQEHNAISTASGPAVNESSRC
jgi:hypothetical protein